MNGHVSFIKTDVRPTARYVSAKTVYEECLHNGRWISLYWSSTGQIQRENISSNLPAPLDPMRVAMDSFQLEMDGQSLHNHWLFQGGLERDGGRTGTCERVVQLRHQVRPVDVKVVTCLDGTGALTRYLEVTNTGNRASALSRLSPMSGLLWHNDVQTGKLYAQQSNEVPFTLGYYRSDSWGEEGNFCWQALTTEVFKVARTWGCPYSAPDYIVKNEVTGELFYIALAWSGNYQAEFSLSRKYCALTFTIGPQGKAPLRLIEPGETIKTPEVHIMPSFNGMDQTVSEWYRHFRSSIAPARSADKKMFTMAARVIEEPGDWILNEIEIAAEMGVEAFMVDAGWYGKTFASWVDYRGDWQEGGFLPGKGIETIRAAAHERGLLFGMWLEPEVMGSKSSVLQAHPEWALVHAGGPSNQGMLINFANPEAANHVEKEIRHVIEDYRLDFYKTDYNNRIPEGGQGVRDGYLESEEWRHYEILYAIYEQVLKDHPEIVLENCAGGGGRLDMGMMSHFHYGCESDWSVMPFSIRAINALTFFLPPESLCYYHNHIGVAHQQAELDTHLRVTLFALPIFVGFGAQNASRDSEYFMRTRYYIDLHKTFCRHVLGRSPVVYHHTPDIGLLKPANWCVLEYALADRNQGYIGVFKIGDQPSEKCYQLRFKGVDPARDYKIEMDNNRFCFHAHGSNLMMEGIRIELDHAGLSELVLYTVMT